MSKIAPITITVTKNSEFDNLYHSNSLRKPNPKTLEQGPGLLFASDPLRIKWDILVTMLGVYNWIFQPFVLSFGKPDSWRLSLKILDVMSELVFLFDIYLNLRTSYIDRRTGLLITNNKTIFKKYIQNGRFFLDILSSIPLSIMLFEEKSPIFILNLLKILRVLRISIVIYNMRIKEIIKRWVRIFRILLFILLYLHILACAWNVLVSDNKTWAMPADYHSKVYLSRYNYAFYAAISTLLQFELTPTTEYEYLFCIFFSIFGALIFSYFLGEITILVTNLNRSQSNFHRQMESISSVVKKLKLPSLLNYAINQHCVDTNKVLSNHKEWKKFQKLLSPSWICKLNIYLYMDIVKNHSTFSEFPEIYTYIVDNLQYRFLLSGQTLIQMGDDANSFYLIVNGSFEVWARGVDNELHMVRELVKGDYCGEIGLLYNIPRTASVRAVHYCSCGLLKAQVFHKLISICPTLEDRFRGRASFYSDPQKQHITVISK